MSRLTFEQPIHDGIKVYFFVVVRHNDLLLEGGKDGVEWEGGGRGGGRKGKVVLSSKIKREGGPARSCPAGWLLGEEKISLVL